MTRPTTGTVKKWSYYKTGKRKGMQKRMIYCKGWIVTNNVYYDINHFGLFENPWPDTHYKANYHSAAVMAAVAKTEQ